MIATDYPRFCAACGLSLEKTPANTVLPCQCVSSLVTALRAEIATARAELAEMKSAQYQPFEKIMSMEEWRSLSAQSRINCNGLGLRVEELEKSNMAAQVIITALKAAQEWISVADRLPLPDADAPGCSVNVLAFFGEDDVRQAYIIYKRGLWAPVDRWAADGVIIASPTHWRPMLPAPKVVEIDQL